MSPIQKIRKSIRIDVSGSLHVQEVPSPAKGPKVTFQNQVRCIGSQSIQESDEKRWYSKEEIASSRKRDNKYIRTIITSRAVSLTGDNDFEDISLVGLLSLDDHKQRLKRIRDARYCVTKEQLNQEEQFFAKNADLDSFQLNHESIADVYSDYSRKSAIMARMRGLQVSCHVDTLSAGTQQSCREHLLSFSAKRPSRKYPLLRSSGSINIFSRLKRAS